MSTKVFTVDKFLGLNESPNGSTGLKLGEASRAENFYVTDDRKIKTRPGIVRWKHGLYRIYGAKQMLDFVWSGYIEDKECVVAVAAGEEISRVYLLADEHMSYIPAPGKITHLFQHKDKLYTVWKIADSDAVLIYHLYITEDGGLDMTIIEPYIPLAIAGASPQGGGTSMEPLNILTDKFRVQFTSADGAKDYVLPPTVSKVVSVHIAGHRYAPEHIGGTFDAESHTFTLGTNPADGVEVIFVCTTSDADLLSARKRFMSMPKLEYFNGATDNRIFFYGDSSNVCYYSGIPAFGDCSGYDSVEDGISGINDGTRSVPGLYIPAGNEIAVDFSASPITALVRDYSRLLVYKPDGVGAITYGPMTLANGSVIAGFYLHTVSREFGNDAMGQVVTVNNCPWSFTHNSIYEWRITSASYKDERYAKCISQKIAQTLATADSAKFIACDDNKSKTFYLFLNDDLGTVLVNRYDLDAWTIYRSHLTTNVTQAFVHGGRLMFVKDREIFVLDSSSTFDDPLDDKDERVPIPCAWESGYMAFGADYIRKYSSTLWISMLPEPSSKMDITVKTDRRDEYMVKSAGRPLLDFSAVDFSNFSFLISRAPKIQRIKLKVKKFVYYKLIFKVNAPGARATILGYDQEVRYASHVK